jgi:predicted DNA-binding protein
MAGKNMGTKTDLSKQERIDEEIKRLNRLYKAIGKSGLKRLKSLIERAAFLTIQCEDLEDHMVKNGVTSDYQNGENQWGSKESPESMSYDKKSKTLLAIISKLDEYVPKDPPKPKGDDFDEFVNGRDDT